MVSKQEVVQKRRARLKKEKSREIHLRPNPQGIIFDVVEQKWYRRFKTRRPHQDNIPFDVSLKDTRKYSLLQGRVYLTPAISGGKSLWKDADFLPIKELERNYKKYLDAKIEEAQKEHSDSRHYIRDISPVKIRNMMI